MLPFMYTSERNIKMLDENEMQRDAANLDALSKPRACRGRALHGLQRFYSIWG